MDRLRNRIHVSLQEDEIDKWLDGGLRLEDVQSMSEHSLVICQKVNPKVGNVKAEGKELIEESHLDLDQFFKKQPGVKRCKENQSARFSH